MPCAKVEWEVDGEEEVIQTDLFEYPGQRRWGLSQNFFFLFVISSGVFWHFQKKKTTTK